MCNTWNALVRPVLEYGAEIWGSGSWEAGERLHHSFGKFLLGIGNRASNSFMYSELGWWDLTTRRDLIKLRYWHKIISMVNSRLTKKIFLLEKKERKPNS